jgi:riboflavin synthase
MFSGLIVHNATVVALVGNAREGLSLRITVEAAVAAEVKPADSVCVNGVCLTATQVSNAELTFDVVPETLAHSSLADLPPGERVNLELPLRVGDRIGGHFVYGHVDRTVKVLSAFAEGTGMRFSFEIADELRPCIAVKGFVALDGVSLTVAAVQDHAFEVAVIPETLRRTTLGRIRPGSRVNLEVDPLARYAVAAVRSYDQSAVSSEELAWAYEI